MNLQLLNKDNTKIGEFLRDVMLNEEMEELMAEEDGRNLEADDISINSNDENALEGNASR